MTHLPTDPDALHRELVELRATVERLQDELATERRQRILLDEIGRTMELERLLDILDGEIGRLGSFDGYLINVVNSDRSGLTCARARMPASHVGMEGVYTNFRFELDANDPIVEAYRTGETIYIDASNVAQFEGVAVRGFESWSARSMVIVPISYGEGAIGTVVAFRQQSRIDSKTVSTFLERLRLFNEQFRNALTLHAFKQDEHQVQAILEDHRRFLQFVSEVNKLTSPELIYQAIVEEFLRAFQFDLGFLSLAENGGLLIQHVSVRNPDDAYRREKLLALMTAPMRLERNQGASAFAFLQNSHIMVPDASAIRHIPMAKADVEALDAVGDVRTVLHMPIRQHGNPIGMLGLFSLVNVRPFTPSELKIIEMLASFVGTAIVNAQLYHVIGDQKGQIEALNRELQTKIQLLDEMVRRDQLTGLHNFGAFRTELSRRTSEFSRQSAKEGLSLAVIDVDHFKRFNDTHGHLAGNLVLQELASRIGRTARAMDIPCRFGGEEFVVILPRCDLDGASIFAERLRVLVAETPFQVDGQMLPVTVSVGCASYVTDEAMDAFLARADAALYRAKANGRNRVELA